MHVMIDLETLDSVPNSAILQIGAVKFSPYGEIGDKLSLYLNEVNGAVSMDTVAWWLGQSKEAVTDLVKGLTAGGRTYSLKEAMLELADFCRGAEGVWSHGATFDIPIVRVAAKRVGVTMPWKFWNEYDTRTLYLVKGKPTVKRDGVFHNAVDDAVYQAQCVQEVMCRK